MTPAPILTTPPSTGQERTVITRRLFLQAVAAGATVAALPNWLAEPAAAASPLGPNDGTLVLLTMAGGNDGLNTFIPVTAGAYHDARRSLALGSDQAIPITDDRGLHPNLGYLKQQWDQGNMAIIDGVGQAGLTMSHFDSMARVMMMANPVSGGGTGWLGRYLDGLPRDPFNGISLGPSVPLLVKGRASDAIALPEYRGNIFDVGDPSKTEYRQYQALRAMGSQPTGLGSLADSVATTGVRAVNLAGTVRPLVEEQRDEAKVVTKLRLAARLINANLGIRVISIVFGDFDTHANQRYEHGERMKELDAGVKTFFQTLNPSLLSRSLIVGTSEFGRRVAFNGSGTDHGQANSLFAIGQQVNGGIYGEMPSLTQLSEFGNLKPTVDFSQFYANLATTWLGADARQILGRDYGDIGFLNAPGATTSGKSGPVTGGSSTTVQKRAQIIRLHIAAFGADPSDGAMDQWATPFVGGSRSLVSIANSMIQSDRFRQAHGSLNNAEFVRLLYRNMFDRGPGSSALTHWTNVLSQGTSRGKVLGELSQSEEFRKVSADRVWRVELIGPVGRLYRAYFLRRPDDQGLTYWINSRLALNTVSDEFAASKEFTNRYGALNNAEFVELVYRNVLARQAEKEGFDYWLRLANRGTPRGDIMTGFSNSAEFIRKVKELTR